MKTKIILAAAVLLLAVAGWLVSMQMQSGESPKQETALEHAAKHINKKYQCPMHPQIIRDQPGRCPICGMDLVPMEVVEPDAVEKKILYYRHPHKPDVRSDKPMKDEMGMDFIPVYENEKSARGVEVTISPVVENNLGVRTASAERSALSRRIDTVAYVDYDGSKLSHVHLRTEGWIEQLAVSSEGDRVRKGQRLFNVYSPTLVNAMEEYVQALQANNSRLIDASGNRLIALGISPGQIDTLKKDKPVPRSVPVYAMQDGIVSVLNVREGMYVVPDTEIMRLADLSTVWLLADVFESQAAWVSLGQKADVSLSYLPGKVWQGRVEYLYPGLDAKTRTLRVRLRFANPDETLKPNMYAQVSIYGAEENNLLVIPREALIRTGQAERVIVSLGDGRFAPREVVSGMESGDRVAILQGLNEGESVVVSGQFLIDSEASLRASLMRMEGK
jgi:Cu(I)/Ag(I) efflux system membrane fusion protein